MIVSYPQLSVFTLLLAVATSGHVLIADSLGVRLPTQALFVFLLLFGIVANRNIHLNRPLLFLVLLSASGLLGELLHRLDIFDALGYCLAIAVVMYVSQLDRKIILNFIETFNYINALSIIFTIALFIASFYSSEVFKSLFIRSPYYSSSFLSGITWHSLFGHADHVLNIGGLEVPRISAHLQQTSLIPAYFFVPLGLYCCYATKINPFVVFVIILFGFLSFGGNTFFALIVSFGVYVCSRVLPATFWLLLPYFVLTVVSVVMVFLTFDSYDASRLKDAAKESTYIAELSLMLPLWVDPDVTDRLASGLVRLSLLGFQLNGFFDSALLPAKSEFIHYTVGSNLFSNGLRGGILGFAFAIVVYWYLFNILSAKIRQKNKNGEIGRFGACLLYAAWFQAFVYNDYGFSTYVNIIFMAMFFSLNREVNRAHHI